MNELDAAHQLRQDAVLFELFQIIEAVIQAMAIGLYPATRYHCQRQNDPKEIELKKYHATAHCYHGHFFEPMTNAHGRDVGKAIIMQIHGDLTSMT